MTSSLSPTTLVSIATALTSSIITSLASAATSEPTLAASAAHPSQPNDDEGTGECQLLGPFAVLVQAALGLLALSSLVFKRWRERPQRPLKIWAFDASKQVFGSVLLHLANLVMSMFSAGQIQRALAKAAADTIGVAEQYKPNPCSFYLLNLAIDTTLGIPILIVILKVLNVGASYTPLARPLESIKSGYYGTPPRVSWWLKQSLIYFLGLLGMKSCVFFIFHLLPWIGHVGDWALRWTEGNEALQIAFVMLIFPLIMNAMQYYIIDIFIKGKETSENEVEREEDGSGDEQDRLLASERRSQGESLDEDEADKAAITTDKSGARAASKEALVEDEVDSTDSGESSRSPGDNAQEEATSNPPRI